MEKVLSEYSLFAIITILLLDSLLLITKASLFLSGVIMSVSVKLK